MTALIFSWPWREILDELSTCSQRAFLLKVICAVDPGLMNDNASEMANINQTLLDNHFSEDACCCVAI